MTKLTTKIEVTVVSLMLACLSAFAVAKDYKVELLVFENLNHQQAYESYQYRDMNVLDSGATMWQIEPSMLKLEATVITESPDYCLLHYYSWGQESLPFSKAAAVEVAESTLTGWVKVYANHLLYANLDLDFNGYRMIEKRRIKLDEKHFFDHPKFGILIQVSRLENNTLENSTLENSTESPGLERELPVSDTAAEIQNRAIDLQISASERDKCVNLKARQPDILEPAL